MQYLCKEPKQTENTHIMISIKWFFIHKIHLFILYKGELPKAQVIWIAHYCRDLLMLMLPTMIFSMYAMLTQGMYACMHIIVKVFRHFQIYKGQGSKCLFYVATHDQTERLIYSNWTISAFGLVKNWHFLTPQSYITSS